METPRNLIITADDFGADVAVNDAVEIGCRDGVLTAASLMVAAPGAADAVARALRTPTLRVGLHVVLVDGRPLLPPAQIPHLVDTRGRFRDNMVAAGAMMFFHPVARRELEAEITAQFEAFTATGLELDHVNTHKHFHLHPTIAGLILKIGRRHGMKAVRIPLEPRGPLAALESVATHPADAVFDLWAGRARRRLRRAGITTPDHVFGLRWSGAMSAKRLAGLIESLPTGLTEIYLHPATEGVFYGAAAGYGYREEFAALCAPEVVLASLGTNIRLGGYTDFTP
jgi:hopanoid biosynthesis associated protein HpnK